MWISHYLLITLKLIESIVYSINLQLSLKVSFYLLSNISILFLNILLSKKYIKILRSVRHLFRAEIYMFIKMLFTP